MKLKYSGMIRSTCVALLVSVGMASTAFAQDQSLEAFVNAELRPFMQKSQILEAVKASNIAHSSDTPEQIAAKDNEWRAEVGKDQQPFIRSVLSNTASQLAKSRITEAKGLISEIIVMDAAGITVGCWPATSDYYQGDEDQHKMTFAKGANARFIAKERLDESTEQAQRQLSLTLVDPADGKPIGAITFGLDAERLR